MRLALTPGSTVAVLSADRSDAADLIEALAPRLSSLGVTLLEVAAHAEALQAPRAPACTLLVARDPSAATEGRHLDVLQRHERNDATLRAALIGAGLPFAVIHGRGAERLANALRALGLGTSDSPRRIAARDCDKCSDPECEHRLFTDLLRRRVESGIGA